MGSVDLPVSVGLKARIAVGPQVSYRWCLSCPMLIGIGSAITEGQGVVNSGEWHVVIQPKLNAHQREVRLLQFCSRVELPVETGIP